jgi:hypothetical protein
LAVLDDFFHVRGEVGVENRYFSGFLLVRLRQRNALGDGAVRRGWRMDHGHRQLAALDHDFDSGTYPRQHVGEVAGGFRFRDVDDMLRYEDIISPLIISPTTIPSAYRSSMGRAKQRWQLIEARLGNESPTLESLARSGWVLLFFAHIDSIATLTIRRLDEGTKARLRVRAAHHGRSMDEEAGRSCASP